MFTGVAVIALGVCLAAQAAQTAQEGGTPVPPGDAPTAKVLIVVAPELIGRFVRILKASLLFREKKLVFRNLRNIGPSGDRMSYILDVDCSYRDGSQILAMTQYLACSAAGVTVIHFDEPGREFDCIIGIERDGKVVAIPFEQEYGVRNFVGSGVLGQFLRPFTGAPVLDHMYSTSGVSEIHLQNKGLSLAESAATLAEELFHCYSFSKGEPWRHGEKGVDQAIIKLRRQARENARK
jgi:hypothetical protein